MTLASPSFAYPISPAKKFASVFCLWLLLLGIPGLANEQSPPKLVIPDTAEAFRVPQSYFTGLLRKALIKGADGRPVPLLLEQPVLEQGRATTELIRGRLIDVYWMGTNKQREAELRPIRIPLTRGLVGYRQFVINRDKKALFDQVKTLDDLKKFTACQGLDWPDTRIMRTVGLRVRELASTDAAYKYLARGTCDYFPRGYFEIDSELAERSAKYPKLISYDGLVLHYPFALYFFVSRDNEALGQWIERGFERMIDSGEFLAFMKQHPLTAHVFPLAHPGMRMIGIENPELSSADHSNPRYWTQPSEFRPAHKIKVKE